MKGVWGNGDPHGNGKKLLAVLRVLNKLKNGEYLRGQQITFCKDANPTFFDGRGISEEGEEVLRRVTELIPAALSKDGLRYLDEKRHAPEMAETTIQDKET